MQTNMPSQIHNSRKDKGKSCIQQGMERWGVELLCPSGYTTLPALPFVHQPKVLIHLFFIYMGKILNNGINNRIFVSQILGRIVNIDVMDSYR